MVELRSTVDRRHGVTFVAAVVVNDRSTPQRVQLRSTIDGPVWPPRRNGVVAPRWSGRTWNDTLEPGERRGVGFASPGEPDGAPVELLAAERASGSDDPSNPRSVLATLERWRPPREVGRDP